MSSEWLPSTVGQFCPFKYGKNLPERDRQKGCVPVVTSAGIVGKHNSAHVESGGVVVGRKGTVGSVTLLEEPFWPIDTAFYVEDLPEVRNLRFTYYLLRTLGLEKMNTDSAVPGLNRDNAHALRISVPKLKHQREIAESLQALDDRITLLRETNATLEAIAQALFKSWFVDFDPVRAKLESRTPEGMDEATAALFPDGFEESELGLVPRGWRVLPIGDAVEAVGGATPDTKNPAYWEPEVHCWTTPKDLSGIAAPVLLDTERKLSDEGLAKIGSGALPIGTLLLSSRAPIGYLALAQVPLAINQGYIAMLPGGLLPPLYMLFWCRQNMENIKGRANGSTFMEISKKAFRPIPALVPPPEIVQEFVEVAGVLFERLIENEKQAQTLATLRDTLLPRLISGQLRLPDVA